MLLSALKVVHSIEMFGSRHVADCYPCCIALTNANSGDFVLIREPLKGWPEPLRFALFFRSSYKRFTIAKRDKLSPVISVWSSAQGCTDATELTACLQEYINNHRVTHPQHAVEAKLLGPSAFPMLQRCLPAL